MNLLQYLTRKLGEPAQDGDRLAFPCPMPGCHNPGNPHFRVKLDGRGGVGQCVKCKWVPKGQGWDIYRVIAHLEKKPRLVVMDQIEAVVDPEEDEAFFRGLMNDPTDRVTERPTHGIDADLGPRPIPPRAGAFKRWESWFLDLLRPPTVLGLKAQDYLFSRGISREHILKYHLRYCDKAIPAPGGHDIANRFHGRVMIPILHGGRVVFFQGRTFLKGPCQDCSGGGCDKCGGAGIVERVPKYKNAKTGVDAKHSASHFLYGLDDVRGSVRIVSVEGGLDRIKLGGASVATLGKGMTDHRMRLLVDAGVKRLITWFDPDVPQDERRKTLDLASTYMDEVWWTETMTGNKDAGAMTPAEHRLTLKAARLVKFEDEL